MNLLLSDVIKKYYIIVSKYKDFNKGWFVFGNARFLAPTTIDRKKDEYFKKSELTEDTYITIHQFRHSHVSLVINEYIKSAREKNISVDTKRFFIMMSNRMGHTVDVMEKTYLHLFPAVQDEIIDLLNNLT